MLQMLTEWSRKSGRGLGAAVVLAAMVAAPALPSMAQPAAAAADAKEEQAVRQKWENIVQFYGEEESSRFSLRILDRDAKEEADFVFKEIWKYDRENKKWVKMDAPPQARKAVPADQKRGDAPPDSQVLAELPIRIEDVGLYYAKWTMNGVPCATYMRLGPRARDRTDPGKAPAGYMKDDVPISVDKAELQIIPDPRYHTGEGSLELPKK